MGVFFAVRITSDGFFLLWGPSAAHVAAQHEANVSTGAVSAWFDLRDLNPLGQIACCGLLLRAVFNATGSFGEGFDIGETDHTESCAV
jgi:hypothetical protein